MNGYQYIEDTIDCMICNDKCTSSTCSDGPRILPWTQDYDDGFNCSNENELLCQENDETGDIWDLWDITLRDLVITSSNGSYITRINLTGNNPDPSSDCGNVYYDLI